MSYKKTTVVSTIIVLLVPALSFANLVNPIAKIGKNFYDVLVAILSASVHILFPILVLMIVYTGFLFVKAQGNPGELEKAKQALMWTLIGGLIILGSVAFAEVVKSVIKP